MWQPFTEEHQQFRKTVRAFAEKELAPHVEEWEHDELFPNWVFKRAGELVDVLIDGATSTTLRGTQRVLTPA